MAESIEPAGLVAWRSSQRYFWLDERWLSEPGTAGADDTLNDLIRLEPGPEPEAMRHILAGRQS
ncbi:hypothetical protein M3M30_04680 [Methylococcus capsulatus]|uniref:hypothetical protein n=1 Tax=Methylococcus capsulatus TaxID=414 RepID=UPI0020175CE6|nr:hypothetical protein [Methylococcus capsulatus]UQN13152.1 hypothetical protein M3M30_04680 [Methylococcus capsulatus]